MLVFSPAAQFFLTESDFLARASRKRAWVHSSPDRQPAGRRPEGEMSRQDSNDVGVNLRSILPTVASPSCLRMRGPTAAALQNKTPSVPGGALSSNRTL